MTIEEYSEKYGRYLGESLDGYYLDEINVGDYIIVNGLTLYVSNIFNEPDSDNRRRIRLHEEFDSESGFRIRLQSEPIIVCGLCEYRHYNWMELDYKCTNKDSIHFNEIVNFPDFCEKGEGRKQSDSNYDTK